MSLRDTLNSNALHVDFRELQDDDVVLIRGSRLKGTYIEVTKKEYAEYVRSVLAKPIR